MARRPLETEQVCLDGGRRTTQLMRESLDGGNMDIARLLVAHILAALAAPVAAFGGGLLLGRAAGRLTRWRNPDGSPGGWMVSMPLGGFGWQVSSVVARAAAAFAAMRLVFWILAVQPTVYAAAYPILILAAWDVQRLRLMQRPPLQPPAQALAVGRFRIGAGLIASAAAAILFLRA